MLPGQTIADLVTVSADPAVGNDIVYTATDDMVIHSIRFALTTSAVVANRQVYIAIDDGATEYLRIVHGSSQAASLSYTYHCFNGVINAAPAGSWININLPANGLIVRKGDRLTIGAFFKDAGDDFGVARILAEILP